MIENTLNAPKLFDLSGEVALVTGAGSGIGALSIALNAAGVANACPAETMIEDQYQTLMDVNLKSVFLSC